MNLFSNPAQKPFPLALKYRPKQLSEFFGQAHLIWEKWVLKPFIQKGSFINAIFRGNPWTGKTTLAELISKLLKYEYVYLNATKASTTDIKNISQTAQKRRDVEGIQTLVFLDEIHRFNKLQQDALLEDLELGHFILIWATTENPYYNLNNALLSRCLCFEFKKLSETELFNILKAIDQKEQFWFSDEILTFLSESTEWDARSAINLLELISKVDQNLSLEEIKNLIPTNKSYHKTEDKYNTISAMIKSIRGSDPDAAVYWLAKMLAGWEDPEYIARRLTILAAEDIWLANPQALPIATAALHAAKELWMPEIRIPLAEVAIYLALSPKSNSAYNAINTALDLVSKQDIQEVPLHLTKLWANHYKYPHNFKNHYTDQQYLQKPLELYIPCENKFETAAQERLKSIKK